MKARNKVFVVTGAARGMGRELTWQLVDKGAKVAMVDIHEKDLKRMVRSAGFPSVSMHVMDITDRENVKELPNRVMTRFGSIDGLINNAGIIQPFENINNLDYETMERILNVNLYGTLYMTKAFLPYLLKRPEAHIANVSSMGGFIPFPGQTFYSASKAAVKLLTEGLYAELKGTNVGVTIMHPGAVNTNIKSNSGLEISETESASEKDLSNGILPAYKAAEIMIDAIEKNKFRVMVGKDARKLDILYRTSPKMSIDLIAKKMGDMKF